MQEKSIGQCRHGQELRAFLLAPQTRTLESQFAFIKAPSKFDLPSACIRKDHAPGLFIGRNWLSGQQIPGGCVLCSGRPPTTGACPDGRGASPAAPAHWHAPSGHGDYPRWCAPTSRVCQRRCARLCVDCLGRHQAGSHRASAVRSVRQRPVTRPAKTRGLCPDRKCAPLIAPTPPVVPPTACLPHRE